MDLLLDTSVLIDTLRSRNRRRELLAQLVEDGHREQVRRDERSGARPRQPEPLGRQRQAREAGQPADVLRQVATQLQAELPPKISQIALQVRRIKGKGSFQTLVCRLATAA